MVRFYSIYSWYQSFNHSSSSKKFIFLQGKGDFLQRLGNFINFQWRFHQTIPFASTSSQFINEFEKQVAILSKEQDQIFQFFTNTPTQEAPIRVSPNQTNSLQITLCQECALNLKMRKMLSYGKRVVSTIGKEL